MTIHSNPEQWNQLLGDLAVACGMTLTLYDIEGAVIVRSGELANDLCRLVQGDTSARTTICSVAQQNIGQEARISREPAVGECDLGMVKLVVPILEGDDVVGFIGTCGLREPDVELETFLASRTLQTTQEALAGPVATVGTVTPEVIERTGQTIQQALADRSFGR